MNAALQRGCRLLRRRWRWASALLVVLALFVGADATRRALDARRDLLQAADDLSTTRATLGPLLRFDAGAWPNRQGYESLVQDVAAAQQRLQRARRRLGYLRIVARGFRWLPGWGGQAAHAPRALDLGVNVTGQALALLRDVEPLFLGGGNTADRAREVLVVRHDDLDRQLAALESSAGEARALQAVHWSGPFGRARGLVDGLVADLDRVHQVREVAAAAATGLDPLLGFDRPRTYVIAGMNESEIRATGGFPGSLGIVTIRDGRIVSSRYDRVEAFERPPYPQPPEELARWMGADWWWLRDANWWPDFPTSARAMLKFLSDDLQIAADGVIALNTLEVGRLVEVFQPITLPEYAQTLTGANWRGVVERTLLAGGSTPEATYLHPLMAYLIDRGQQAAPAQIPLLLRALASGAASRDLQAYAVEPRLQALFETFGVSGALAPPRDGAVLAVVDSNVSWSKIQPAISRETLYLAGVDGVVDVRVRWTNDASRIDPQTYPRLHRYGDIWDPDARRLTPAPAVFGNYVRIYLPAAATAVAIRGFDGSPRLVRAGGFTIVSGLVIVPDGASRAVHLSYRLPEEMRGVVVWKQGGQARDALQVLRNARAANAGAAQSTLYEGVFERDVVVRW